METIDTKQRFIELRAKGWSFDKIAKELGKAKQTLLDWSRDLKEEIANYKALELEALYEGYYLLKEARIRKFGEIIGKLNRELEKRDLSDLPTDKLLGLYLKYSDKVKEEIIEPNFKTSEEMREEKLDRELIDELTAPQTLREPKLVH